MTDPGDPCPFCGAGSGRNRAFVIYHAEPNDAQMQTGWFEGLPLVVYAVVCMTCGEPAYYVDPRDADDLPDFKELPRGTDSSRFRVDDELR